MITAMTNQMIAFRGTEDSSGGAERSSSVCFPQRGHWVVVPTSSAGNSIDPPHSLQAPCKRLVWFILLRKTNPNPERRHAIGFSVSGERRRKVCFEQDKDRAKPTWQEWPRANLGAGFLTCVGNHARLLVKMIHTWGSSPPDIVHPPTRVPPLRPLTRGRGDKGGL